MNRSGRSTSPTVPGTPDRNRPILAEFFLLLLGTLVAYFPGLRGEFLWDDAGHVTSPALQSWSGLLRIWAEPGATQQYYPLLHSAFWLEHQLWGDASIGYHLVNVLWHTVSACLFIVLLRRLVVPGALLAGWLFALHPVCVESVAWISEQKNTLSLVFYLAAALAWLRFEDKRTLGRYAAATLWFCAALLTKTVTATLPCALLVLAWWRRGSLSWRADALPLLPWLFLGITAGLSTAWFESTHIGATGQDFALGPVERTILAARVVCFYFAKLVWPTDLAFFYPRWTIDAGIGWQWLFPAAMAALLSWAVWRSRRGRMAAVGMAPVEASARAPLAVALLFGGTLFPALGFVNVYPFVFSYVADHFQYHASLAVIAFFSAMAVRAWQRIGWPPSGGRVAGAALLLVAAAQTWQQSGHFRNDITLYRASIAQNPDSWVAHLNLGVALADTGQNEEAVPHLQRALTLKPDHPETLNSLGNVLNQLGRSSEALPLIERALQVQPKFAAAHNTRGAALMARGRTSEGLAAFEEAVRLDPTFVLARTNLGWALANVGRPAEALVQLDQVQREQPDYADAYFKAGMINVLMSRPRNAEPHLRRAVELQPGNPEHRAALATLFLELGRPAEAAAQYEAALELAPGHPGILRGLEEAHRRLGR